MVNDGAPASGTGSREPDQQAVPALSGFDPSRLRAIPVWMVGSMTPGWQEQGTSAYHGAEAIERLERALTIAVEALRTVGDDYPGSSCQLWCHREAEKALHIASGMSAGTAETARQAQGEARQPGGDSRDAQVIEISSKDQGNG